MSTSRLERLLHRSGLEGITSPGRAQSYRLSAAGVLILIYFFLQLQTTYSVDPGESDNLWLISVISTLVIGFLYLVRRRKSWPIYRQLPANTAVFDRESGELLEFIGQRKTVWIWRYGPAFRSDPWCDIEIENINNVFRITPVQVKINGIEISLRVVSRLRGKEKYLNVADNIIRTLPNSTGPVPTHIVESIYDFTKSLDADVNSPSDYVKRLQRYLAEERFSSSYEIIEIAYRDKREMETG